MNNHIVQVLSIRPFLYLFLAEIFSQIAMNMVNFVLIIVAFGLTKSNTAVSGIVLSFTIPAVVFGIIAGVYVDRWNKKRVLIVTNLIRAGLLILLVFLHTNLFIIYVLSFVIAIVTQFFIPAETPMIPILVKKELLLSANALFGMGIYGSILVAYALSGTFLLLYGNVWTFVILALFFLLAGLFASLIRSVKKKELENLYNGNSLTIGDEIKGVLSLIIKTKQIYQSLFLLTLSQILILIIAVIGPGYASSVLKVNVEQFPLLFVTPAALGMVIGALAIGHFFADAKRKTMADIGVLVSGFSMLLLPYGSKVTSKGFIDAVNNFLPTVFRLEIIHFMIFLAFVLGVAAALVFVPSNTILQEETSDEARGKVYGALNALTGIFSLFPIIIVGSLADILGVTTVVTGIGTFLLVLFVLRIVIK